MCIGYVSIYNASTDGVRSERRFSFEEIEKAFYCSQFGDSLMHKLRGISSPGIRWNQQWIRLRGFQDLS